MHPNILVSAPTHKVYKRSCAVLEFAYWPREVVFTILSLRGRLNLGNKNLPHIYLNLFTSTERSLRKPGIKDGNG